MEKDKQINNIRLVFENCESILLLPSQIEFLSISDVKKNYFMADSKLGSFDDCDLFSIILKSDALELYPELCAEHISEINLRDRLRGRDLTHISLCFEDGSDSDIAMPWGNENYTNENEYHFKRGEDILIVIRKGELNEGEYKDSNWERIIY